MTPEERTRRALTDILGFADEISQYVTSLGEQNFYSHRPTQLIAEALLHRIGEAVSRLEGGLVAEHPAVEWQKMKGMTGLKVPPCCGRSCTLRPIDRPRRRAAAASWRTCRNGANLVSIPSRCPDFPLASSEWRT